MPLRRNLYSALAVLLIGVGIATDAMPGEIEAGVREIKKGQEKGDFEQIVDGLESVAYRFKDIIASQNKAAGIMNDAADEIIKAMKVYNQDPLILEDIKDAIDKDTAAIEAKGPTPYRTENPITEDVQAKLASSSPSDRRQALKEVRSKLVKQKEAVHKKVADATRSKTEASTMVGLAEATEKRGLDLENVLRAALDSPVGGVFTIASHKFGEIFLDMALYVNPALARRVSATRDYLKRSTKELSSLEGQLAELDNFEQWVGYYQWELDMKFPSEEFEKSIAMLEDLDRLQGKLTNQKSAEARRIGKLVETTVKDNQVTKERAEALVQYARFKDANVARIEAFGNLFNLGASVAGMSAGGAKSSSGVPSSTKSVLDEFDQISKQQPTILRAGPSTPPPLVVPKIKTTPGGAKDGKVVPVPKG